MVDDIKTKSRDLRHTMVEVALEEVSDLVTKLDEVYSKVYTLVDSLDGYFEDIGRDTANAVRKGIDFDIDKAHKRLASVHKEVSNSVEQQRKLNVQLSSIANKLQATNNNKYQPLLMFGAAFIGGLIPALFVFLAK